jgi:predicted MFS family arabinose efflux permease
MLMLGAAVGPALGGAVADILGFAAIGMFAGAILIASAACFVLIGALRVPALQAGKA